MSIEMYGWSNHASNLILCIYFIWFVSSFCLVCAVHMTWCDNSTLWLCRHFCMFMPCVNQQSTDNRGFSVRRKKNVLDSVVYFYLKFKWLEKTPHYLHFLSPRQISIRKWNLFVGSHFSNFDVKQTKTKQNEGAQKTSHSMPHCRAFTGYARFSC